LHPSLVTHTRGNLRRVLTLKPPDATARIAILKRALEYYGAPLEAGPAEVTIHKGEVSKNKDHKDSKDPAVALSTANDVENCISDLNASFQLTLGHLPHNDEIDPYNDPYDDPHSSHDCVKAEKQALLSMESPEVSQADLESELSSLTEGYRPGDLWSLAKRVTVQAAKRGATRWEDRGNDRGDFGLFNDGREKVRGYSGLSVLHTTYEEAISMAKEFSPSSSFKPAGSSSVSIGWTDIGGLHSAKQAIIDVFQLPVIYRRLFQMSPIRMPRAILLYGPPGCGKTALAQAAATECGLAFITIRG
jgi:SpoVK/Ycf46/Vps4 family AAA+-type ATPase